MESIMKVYDSFKDELDQTQTPSELTPDNVVYYLEQLKKRVPNKQEYMARLESILQVHENPSSKTPLNFPKSYAIEDEKTWYSLRDHVVMYKLHLLLNSSSRV